MRIIVSSAHTSNERVTWIHTTYTIIFFTMTSAGLKAEEEGRRRRQRGLKHRELDLTVGRMQAALKTSLWLTGSRGGIPQSCNHKGLVWSTTPDEPGSELPL